MKKEIIKMSQKSRGNIKLETSSTNRSFVFTCNNWREEDWNAVLSLKNEKCLIYGICGKEVGSEGTPHLQGYCYFKNPVRKSKLEKMLTPQFWSAVARGSPLENEEYCSKDGNKISWGTLPKQGKRNDWEGFRNRILDGANKIEMQEEYPNLMLQYRHAYSDVRRTYLKSIPATPKELYILYGESGIGKSKYVAEKEIEIWKTPVGFDGTWYDGYDGQEAVWFEEFHGEIAYKDLLRLTDRYKEDVPVKGGFVPWIPKRIYITGSSDPITYYGKNTRELERRIKEFGEYVKL